MKFLLIIAPLFISIVTSFVALHERRLQSAMILVQDHLPIGGSICTVEQMEEKRILVSWTEKPGGIRHGYWIPNSDDTWERLAPPIGSPGKSFTLMPGKFKPGNTEITWLKQ